TNSGRTQGSPLQWKWYAISLVLFVLALLSKSVTSSLPAVVLLIIYWKRGRITMRDVLPLLPFFVLGIAMGALTGWMEREIVGAKGPEFAFGFVERFLIAGRAVWFYATKLIWPHPLIFMYERWWIDPARLWQFAFPLAAAGVVVSLWMLRHRLGRGPLVAALFFGGTLFPALGFVNVLPMRYSFVADHFQYLASLGLLTLFAAGLCRCAPTRVAALLTGIACAALGVLTWRHAHDFKDLETLWTRTLAKNPTSWMARNNYGTLLQERGDYDAATHEFYQAIALKPDHVRARLNLGMIAERRNDLAGARALYDEALAIKPDFAEGHYNLARLLASQGKFDEAAEHYRHAIAADPRNEAAHTNLGVLLAERGDAAGAMNHYRRALEIDPDSYLARVNLGNLYLSANRIDDALAEWNRALAIQPRSHLIRNNIALVLAALGRLDEAERMLREALAIKPDSVDVLTNLGIVRAKKGDRTGAERYLSAAVKLDPNNAKARAQLEALRRP
ncbi:MAG: tetratricopeptide repeat protein, partial [Tepidisphaeraceae bacterium]